MAVHTQGSGSTVCRTVKVSGKGQAVILTQAISKMTRSMAMGPLSGPMAAHTQASTTRIKNTAVVSLSWLMGILTQGIG